MQAKKKESKVVAVIDIGSSSIKMSAARVSRTSWNIILQKKQSLRLLDEGETKISTSKLNALVRAIGGFVKSVKKYDPLIKIYATSAMRRAKNKRLAIKSIRKKFNLRINVISGAEEAMYVYRAVQSSFYVNRGSFGIIDIGGGSIEFVQLQDGKPKWMKSIPMGSVVVKGNFFDEQPESELDIMEKILEIQREIERQIPKELKGYLIISGGSPSSIGKLFLHPKKFNQLHGKVIFLDKLIELFQPMLQKPDSFWINKHKINPARVDLLLPCLCTLIALMRIAGQDHFQISRTGLRQGIIEEAFQRIQKNR